MSASCPNCGVAVVPGYVKCPKCHALLPRVVFKKGQSTEGAGGTSLESSSSSVPVVPLAIGGLVVLAIVGYFAFRKTGSSKDAAAPSDASIAQPAPQPQGPVQPTHTDFSAPPSTPNTPTTNTQPDTPAGPKPEDVAKALQRDLQRQKVFATVTVVPGGVLEVRSGSCADKAARPTVDSVAASAHAAGLTRIRCVEQSGGVVFTRDL